MMIAVRLICFLCASLLLFPIANSAGSDPDGWTSFRGGIDNDGTSYSDPFSQGSYPGINWQVNLGGPVTSSVSVHQGMVAAASEGGKVHLLDGVDGSHLWNRSLDSEVYSTPCFDPENRALVVLTDNGKAYSLSLDDGGTVWSWSSASGSSLRSSPQIFEGRIYFGSYDSNVYCLDAGNGSLIWSDPGCGDRVHTTGGFYRDTVMFGSCSGSLKAFDTEEGEVVWTFTDSYIPSSPAVSDGRVHFGSYDENIYCLDADTGEVVWNTTLDGEIYSSPAVDKDHVVVGSNRGSLYCLDPSGGEIMWTRTFGREPLESSPAIAGPNVIVTGPQGLEVLSLSNGSVIASLELGSCGESSPAVANSTAYYGDQLGYLRSVGFGSDGKDGDDETDDDEKTDRVHIIIALVISVLVLIIIGILFKKRRQS